MTSKLIWSKVQYGFYALAVVVLVVIICKLAWPADTNSKTNSREFLDTARTMLTKIKEYYNLARQDSNLLVAYDHATSAVNSCDIFANVICSNMSVNEIKRVFNVDIMELKNYLVANRTNIKRKLKDNHPQLLGQQELEVG